MPLHKGRHTQDVNHFRPISLLSIFDKIIEQVIHRRLHHFLEHHDILLANQFGFRKNNSTYYALMEITEKNDSGKFGCGIFIDLKNSFGTVNNQIYNSKKTRTLQSQMCKCLIGLHLT